MQSALTALQGLVPCSKPRAAPTRGKLVVVGTAITDAPTLPGASAKPKAGKQLWVATLTSTASEIPGKTAQNLEVSVVDAATGERSTAATVDDGSGWEHFTAGGGRAGWARRGLLAVPASFTAPGAVIVKRGGQQAEDDYIDTIKLATQESAHEVPVGSWVAPEHGERAFFCGTFLPKDTPQALKELRQKELQALRGGDGPQPLGPNARVYGYQVYDDLGKDRPPLGGNAALPYPRHISNSRATGQQGPGAQWLPKDVQFDETKSRGFNGNTLEGIAPAVAQMAPEILLGGNKFSDYEDVLEVFSTKVSEGGSTLDDNDAPTDWDAKVDSILEDATAESDEDPKSFWKRRHSVSIKDLFKFRAPRVLANRGVEVLATDQEWGRQVVAGMNPCVLSALSKLPADQFGSALGPQHVDDELKKLGSPSGMADLVAQAAAGAKPRLFMIDYALMDYFWKESDEAKNRAEHAGRALLYLQQDGDREVGLVPIAFELKHRESGELEGLEGRALKDGQGIVYARQELVGNAAAPGGEALWTLAKMVFKSLDSGFHQLISHWLRCHACLEPFEIALKRQISPLHPLYKLMLPHFRYTLNINSLARKSLINQGGIIEDCFTPGAYCMRLSAAAYGALWRFKSQALPEDLKNRGMLDKDGQPFLADYPYATDGLAIWNEIEAYFKEYLALYYTSDADVAGDVELQAWWSEVKDKGHPDIKLVEPDEAKVWGFAGPIATRDQLLRVLVTIAWTASAHHASVNFGQYDFSSLLLNASSLVRRPIPRPPSAQGKAQADATKAEAKAYKTLTTAKGKSLEGELLSYVADPLSAVKVMVTVKLLSIHAEHEQTLDERNQLITDAKAAAANGRFMSRMQALEARIQGRNADPDAWTRYTGEGGERKAGMKYTLLIPPSQEGLTMKGVPYSVSI